MPRSAEMTASTLRPIIAKLDKWADDERVSGDERIAVHVSEAYDHLHAVRSILRKRAGNGTPAQ
jgi:hypothetical protein